MLRTFILITAIACLVAGCRSQKNPAVRYYTIELPAVTNDSFSLSAPITAYSCEVEKVEVNLAFSSHRIANRQASNELVYYAFHQWAVRPADILTSLNESFFQRAGIFKSVFNRSFELNPDYTLKSVVNRIETTETDKTLKAHLQMELFLLESQSGKVVVYHSADQFRPLAQNSINDFAAGISEMVGDQLMVTAEKIKDYFSNRKP